MLIADIAASIQKFTEEMLLSLITNLHKETKLDSLCIAGGVGLNSAANGMLLEKGPFKRIFIQPAAGDDGGALGAAFYAYHAILGKKRVYTQTDTYFGADFTDAEIENFLTSKKIPYRKITSEEKLVDMLSDALAKDKVIGFFASESRMGTKSVRCTINPCQPNERRNERSGEY